MRYALIADIHGNSMALDAVIKDAKTRNIDKYIFLGDYYMSAPFPNEVIDNLKSFCNAYIIKGNGEDYLINLSNQDQSKWTDGQLQTLYWNFKNITDENKKYITRLPKSHCFTDGNVNIHLSHKSSDFIGNIELKKIGSGALCQKYANGFLPDDFNEHIKKTLLESEEFIQTVSLLEKGVYIFGHVHVQWNFKYKDIILINPGSCGIPLDYRTGAPYSILEISNNNITVQELRVEYDIELLKRAIVSSSLYTQSKVWCDIVLQELSTGYAKMPFFLKHVEKYASSINDMTRPYTQSTWQKASDIWHENISENADTTLTNMANQYNKEAT